MRRAQKPGKARADTGSPSATDHGRHRVQVHPGAEHVNSPTTTTGSCSSRQLAISGPAWIRGRIADRCVAGTPMLRAARRPRPGRRRGRVALLRCARAGHLWDQSVRTRDPGNAHMCVRVLYLGRPSLYAAEHVSESNETLVHGPAESCLFCPWHGRISVAVGRTRHGTVRTPDSALSRP